MSEDMHGILELDDKGMGDTKNPVAKLFRCILLDLNVSKMTWDRLMKEFLMSPGSGIPNNPTKRSSERSNLNRALSKDAITWKMFRKSLNVLNPVSIHYEIDLDWGKPFKFPNGRQDKLIHHPRSRQDDLYKIFTQLITDLGITSKIWDVLVGRWLDDEFEHIRDNPPDFATERGNLRKALLEKKSYTWMTLCKGLSIVGVKNATFTVVLEWKHKTTRHSYSFNTKTGTYDD